VVTDGGCGAVTSPVCIRAFSAARAAIPSRRSCLQNISAK
jgi:hypothetical protein